MAEGLLHGGDEALRPLQPGHPEGGARPHRLDKQGIADGSGGLGQGFRGIGAGDHRPLWDGCASQGGQLVGADLVHAQGAGQGAAADHRHSRQLKEPLNGAVLPVLAVEHRKNSCKGNFLFIFLQQKQSTVSTIQPQGAGDAVRALPPTVLGDGLQGAGVPVPGPLPGDAHRDGAVFFRVHVGEDGVGGLQRHPILGGAPAEQHQNIHGFHRKDLLKRQNALLG